MHVTRTGLGRAAVGLLLLFALLAPPGAPAAAEPHSVEEIIARSIEASGGEEALALVHSVTRSGTLHLESDLIGVLDGTVSESFEPGRRGFQRADLAVAATDIVVDGEVGWEKSLQGIRDLAPDQRNLHWTNWQVNVLRHARGLADAGVRISLLPEQEGAGRQDQHVLEILRPDGTSSRVFVDKSSYLIVKLQCTIAIESFGPAKVTMELSEHAPVEGVMLPRTWIQTIEGLWVITMTFDRITLNAELDATLFARESG